MFILIQVLSEFHSKEENIKQVRVKVWVDVRSRPQAGNFFDYIYGLLGLGSLNG